MAWLLPACEHSRTQPPAPIAVEIAPTFPRVANGTDVQLRATALFDDHTRRDVTSEVLWGSSNLAIAAVDGTGRASGLSPGSATVLARLAEHDVRGTMQLTVTAATLVSIDVTPALPSLAAGTTQQLTATGTFTDSTTQDLTNQVVWSSDDTVCASVDASGLLTAGIPGAANITATHASSGVTGSTHTTTTSAVLVSLAATPTSPQIALGTVQQFAATGTYSDASTQDLTTAVTWSSSNSAIATIDGNGEATSVATGSCTVQAHHDDSGLSAGAALTVTAAELVSIAVTPAGSSLAKGLTQQFTATGSFTDGSTQDLTSIVAWTSSSTATATVSNASGTSGLGAAHAIGSCTIAATAPGSGVSGSTTLTVTAAVLVSLAVTPANPSISNGTTRSFVATGTYSDNTTRDLTTSVTWSSSATGVATVSNASGSEGLATSIATGSCTIQAVDPSTSTSDSTTLTVTAATLVSIEVTPGLPQIANGTALQFTATGVFSDSSTQDLTGSVTWSSSNGSVAAIANTPGSQGHASSTGTGTCTITATDPGTSTSGSTTLTVTSATLVAVEVAPSSATLAAGTAQQFTAVGRFSDNTVQDLTELVQWTSSNSGVATVGDSSGTKGACSTVATGTCTITATDSATALAGSAAVTVTTAALVSLAVTPANPSLPDGASQPFVATGTFSDNTTQDLTAIVTWSSSDTGVATISNASNDRGTATGIGIGTCTIQATDPGSGVTGSTTLTVTAATLLSVAVTPASPTLASGTSQQFVATGTYSDASTVDLTEQVTWSSSNTAVATVSNTNGARGFGSAISGGSTTISATHVATAVSGSTTLTVNAVTLMSIAVSPSSSSIALGATQSFIATGTFSDSSTQDVTDSVTWTTDDAGVATIGNAQGQRGSATSTGVGACTITATHAGSGVTGTASLAVTPSVLVSIAISPDPASVLTGNVRAFTATGTYSDSTTADITATVTWSSSAPGVAQVSNANGTEGRATGVAAGSATITATDPGTLVTGNTVLTVLDEITLRSSSSAGATSGTVALAIATPSGTAAGDVLVAAIEFRPYDATLTPPSGWTLIRRVDNSNNNDNSLALYWRAATTNEPTSHTFTLSTSNGMAGGILAFVGADSSDPIDVENGQNTASSLSHTTPGLVTTADDELLVAVHGHASASTWTPATGTSQAFQQMSSASQNAAGISLLVSTKVQGTAGSTGTFTATAGAHADAGNTALLALRPIP